MKYISIVFLLFFNYILITKAKKKDISIKFPCKGKNGGLLPMQRSCSGYYICIDGSSFVGSCDQYYHFDPLTLRCDHADNVPCEFQDISERDKGLSNEKLTIKKPQRPRPEKLKPQMGSIKPVDFKNHGMAAGTFDMDVANICMGQRNGVLFPKSGVCSQYYICENSHPYRRKCPPNLHFSATRHVCTSPEIAKCMPIMEPPIEVHEEIEKSSMTPVEICTEENQNEFVSHSRDCGKFFVCSNMLFLEMSCPPGLHFSNEKKRCDYPKTAKCTL